MILIYIKTFDLFLLIMIEHIILAGGGIVGLVQFGIIKQLLNNSFIEYDNIKTIYATSVGSVIGLLFILNCDYDDIENYLINRPFEKLINMDLNSLLNIIKKKGIISKSIFQEMIRPPILASKFNLNVNSTLLELYNETKKDFNIITTEIRTFDKIILNHKTFPNLKIYEALMISCGIPGFFESIYLNETFYIDGSLTSNCPIFECIENENCDLKNILIIDNSSESEFLDVKKITKYNYLISKGKETLKEDCTLIDLFIYSFNSILKNYIKLTYINSKYKNLPNNLNYINSCLTLESANLNFWMKVFLDKNEKKKFINIGKCLGNNFYKKNIFKQDINIYDLSNIDLSNIDLSNIDLSNIDLSNIDLFNIDLSNIDLSNIDLSNIDLSNIDLSNINISNLIL